MMDDALSRFLRGLTKEKVQYVALFTDAADATVEEMKNMINSAGATVVDVKKVKGNFLPFLTGVKPEEAAELSAWAKSVIEHLPE
jgi:hypothetical protein